MKTRKKSGFLICTATCQGNATAQNSKTPGDPKRSPEQAAIALRRGEDHDNQASQQGRHRPLRQHAQSQEEIKRCQVAARFALIPRIPREQRDGEHGCERHIRRSCPGKSDHSRRRGAHQSTIELEAGPKSFQKKINRDHHKRRVHCRRQSRGPIAHAKNAVSQHRLPVVERRLLQPGLPPSVGVIQS